jgi:fumarylpyruvate hydrolase
VGRNYAEHAHEMGHDPQKELPFFFSKPIGACVSSGRTLPYPLMTKDVHHEAELCVLIGKSGTEIARDTALDHVWGYAAGNDLTRRDLQAVAKEKRRPWDLSKGFDQSAVIGPVKKMIGMSLDSTTAIRCMVEGEIRQQAVLGDMIWPIEDVIAELSRYVALEAGDLIMTGTPAGVGPIAKGETCVVEIDGLDEARFTYET